VAPFLMAHGVHKSFIKNDDITHQFHNEEMKNEIKTTHLREETLKHNKLDGMVCLKKHPINKISVIMDTRVSAYIIYIQPQCKKLILLLSIFNFHSPQLVKST